MDGMVVCLLCWMCCQIEESEWCELGVGMGMMRSVERKMGVFCCVVVFD